MATYEQLQIPGLEAPPPAAGVARGALAPFGTEERQAEAVLATRGFLARLIDHRQTPRTPRPVRAEARALLKWFPRPEVLRPVLTSSASLKAVRRGPLLPGER